MKSHWEKVSVGEGDEEKGTRGRKWAIGGGLQRLRAKDSGKVGRGGTRSNLLPSCRHSPA